MEYGYARVSSPDQNVDRQLDALRAFPVKDSHIYVDRYTGMSFDRPRYGTLMRRLRPGDVVVVTSIDRLSRNYEEILHTSGESLPKTGMSISWCSTCHCSIHGAKQALGKM